jgi:hypothetical protein
MSNIYAAVVDAVLQDLLFYSQLGKVNAKGSHTCQGSAAASGSLQYSDGAERLVRQHKHSTEELQKNSSGSTTPFHHFTCLCVSCFWQYSHYV